MTEKELKEFQDTLQTVSPFVKGAIALFAGVSGAIKASESASSKGYRGYKNYDDWYQNSPDSPLWDDPVNPDDDS